ncbi:MAG: alpha-galactosidase [Eubacteriales bacterium]|nr:alpha-galactosidase [Eubacteriales bacterium]
MELFNFCENGIYVVMERDEHDEVKFLHFSSLPLCRRDLIPEVSPFDPMVGFKLAEVMVSGEDRPGERHGNKYIITAPGYRLKYQSHSDTRNALGRKLEIVTYDAPTGIEVTRHFQFFDGIPVVRSWTDVTNRGDETRTLEYVASFTITGVTKEGLLPRDKRMTVSIPHNSWCRELQWQTYTMEELGLGVSRDFELSSKVISASNAGNWSAKEYLPMGVLTNTECGTQLFWQIEHNGSWHWEISDEVGHFYLQLSGPTEIESHWSRDLHPGDTFTSVPAAAGVVTGSMDDAMDALTLYRRAIRRPNEDDEKLPIIFNDYMNCLWADPTTEKELPLIDAAAAAGCEYYVVDAGWYAEGYWWDNVGEWLPCDKRFPGGLREVFDYIRSKGMIPGLWLEIEVMGTKCPKVAQTDDSWYFLRHGKRVHDRSRYQLDFRNPAVVAHATEVIDRCVNEYGMGYIKMDYNIEPGIGTETNADSVGDGLLGHQRAYLKWLDDMFAKYPDLVIENCSSGGLRMDYALLQRCPIQSTSDQTDYLHFASIAANAPTGVTPEQAAVWSYPLTEGDREEVVFNMVNALLLRVHQSGQLAQISPERSALVKEGLDVYRSIRANLRQGLPFWPLGLSHFSDEWVSLGMKCGKVSYVAVWRRDSHDSTCVLPIAHLKGKDAEVECIYPTFHQEPTYWNAAQGHLTVKLSVCRSARLFRITEK